ncbi:MAG: hypothetical protein JRF33_22375, partial [Deltaproteobacteria bacterium]|nr:hypothetical protein [Deltaproteobacteria bacterium]
MKVRIKISEVGGLRCNLLVLALDRKFKRNPSFVRLDKACKGKLAALASEERFRGGPGQLCLLSGATGIEADRVLLLGLDRDHPGPAARWR